MTTWTLPSDSDCRRIKRSITPMPSGPRSTRSPATTSVAALPLQRSPAPSRPASVRTRTSGESQPCGSPTTQIASAMRTPLAEEISDQRGPAGLVTRPETTSRVAVKVLIEQHMVAPVRIALEQFHVAEYRSAAVGVPKEKPSQSGGEVVGNATERAQPSRASRRFDQELVTVILVEFAQRLDQQEIDREPDRAAPVGIATEERGAGLARFVTDFVDLALELQSVRIV